MASNFLFNRRETYKSAWPLKTSDENDAIKLAELAAIGQQKPTSVPQKEMRKRRRMIQYLKSLA